MKEKRKNGITLIALVITIVIMLILAGVVVVQLLGDRGLITNTAKSKEIYEYTSAKEEINLTLMSVVAKCEEEKVPYSIDKIIEAIKKDDEKEIEKMFKEEKTASIKSGVEIVNPSDIVITVKKYSKYKFLVGEKEGTTEVEGIKGVTTEKITNTTVINDFKSVQEFEKTILNVNISEKKENTAKVIKGSPNSYYGKTVNYSANKINDWKIFYADNDNIFLITSDYLPITALNTVISGNKTIKSATGLTTTGTCQTYWDNPPSMQEVTSENISFKFSNWSNYSSYNSGKCVSTLLNTDNWVSFVDETYADLAIGGPTIEMWMASWNDIYTTDQLQFGTSKSTYGYQVGESGNALANVIGDSVMKAKEGYTNTLYYPHTSSYAGCTAYRLASPSNYSESSWVGRYVIVVTYTGKISGAMDKYATSVGIRPIVRLKSTVSLTTEGNDSCDFGLKTK